LKEKAIAAKHLQHNLSNRGDTVLKVAKYIINSQHEYFTKGATALTPMTMAEVAEALGYHETTISRAVNGKYMMTPKGLLPFRFFFTAGTSWENPDISNAAIKERVRKMIAEEPANNRLNDDDIVKELRKYGVTIARRTVAKYRLELNILPYHLRGK
jgi:RNA polymerase sigma-54 factor